MTAPGSTGETPGRPVLAERPSLVERVAARVVAVVEPLVARILGVPRIAMANAVYMRFSSSSGPILARGLAFVALFAVVPAVLVILSIVGFFVGRSGRPRRDRGDPRPPSSRRSAPVLDEALASFSGLAPTTGIVGLVPPHLERELARAGRSTGRSGSSSRTPARGARRSATSCRCWRWRPGRSRPR